MSMESWKFIGFDFGGQLSNASRLDSNTESLLLFESLVLGTRAVTSEAKPPLNIFSNNNKKYFKKNLFNFFKPQKL
jgi:hypothetical protein